MKIIIVKAKKVFTVVTLFVLMIMMMCCELQFHNKLKLSTFAQNNINQLKQYSDSKGIITYLLPKSWTTKERTFKGDDIIYHNEFKSDKDPINGYVQIWNKKNNIKEFLEQSKKISEKQNKISNYKIKSLKINNKPAYFITYNIEVSPNNIFKAEEYFIELDKRFIRMSFFISKEDFKDNMTRIFKTIVDTINVL